MGARWLVMVMVLRRSIVPRSVLVVGLILATPLAAAAIGRSSRVTESVVMALAALVVAAVAAPLILRDLGLGLALLPLVGALVPFKLGTGTQSPLVAALLYGGLLLGLWCGQLLLSRRLLVARTPLNGPVVAVTLVWILAYLDYDAELSPFVVGWATFPLVRLAALGVTIVSLGVLLLGANVGRDPRCSRIATWGFLLTSGLALAWYFVRGEQTVPVEMGGLFTMWSVALAYGQAVCNRRLPVPARVALFALAAGWLYKATILQTWWYSGWAPSWLAVLAITWLHSRRGGFAVTLIAGGVVGLNWDTVYEAIWVGAEQKGDFTRLDIWAQLWELIAAHPILGTGPAGYATYFLSLYPSSDSSKSSHSNYLDVLAQTGILGLVAFCWMLLILAMLAWTARRRWPHGFEGAYATSAIGGFVGLLLAMAQGDWLLPFVYNQTIAGFAYTVHSWVFLGLVAGLAGARPRPAGGHAGRAVATGPSGAQVGSPMLQEDSTARESAQLATSSSPGPGSRAVMRASLAL